MLTNSTRHNVTVLGYLGEPYLRVGPSGTFENAHSPSLYLTQAVSNNASNSARLKTAPTRWNRIGNGSVLEWHDHRVHWPFDGPPPQVLLYPSVTHVVIPDWRIPLLSNGHSIVITGSVIWRPGPSPWPWFGSAILAAAVITAVGWSSRRSRSVAMCAVLVGLTADLVWAIDRWNASFVAVPNKLDALFAVFGAVLFGAIAVGLMAKSGRGRGMVAVVIAGVFLVGDFLPENGVWRFSDVPTSLSAEWERLLALITVSCGASLIALGWHQAVWIPGGSRSPDDSPGSAGLTISTKPKELTEVRSRERGLRTRVMPDGGAKCIR